MFPTVKCLLKLRKLLKKSVSIFFMKDIIFGY